VLRHPLRMNDVLRLFKEKKAEEDFLTYHTRRRQAECRNAAPLEEVSTAAPSSSRKPVNQLAISDESAGSTASLSRFDSDLDDLARSILRRIFSAGCSTSFQESSAARKAARQGEREPASAVQEMAIGIRSGKIHGDRLQEYSRKRYSHEEMTRQWVSALVEPEKYWGSKKHVKQPSLSRLILQRVVN
jgi:hypothetical protein